jgi:ribonuclease J
VKIVIHRGTKEIGGTCIEIGSEGKRLVLDLGLPLSLPRDYRLPDAREGGAARRLLADGILPPVDGLYGTGERPEAVLISHPHMDHYGLAPYADRRIPCATGRWSRSLMRFSGKLAFRPYEVPSGPDLADRRPIDIGPFRITPYLVDHSAFDAYALMVEAGGKRILYSGDFRGHGRKRGLFEKLLRRPPRGVDALLMEGTTLSGGGRDKTSEEALEANLVELFRREKGLVLFLSSAQNIDRIVTLYRACLKSGRTMLLDAYAAAVLDLIRDAAKIPQAGWKGTGIFKASRTEAMMRRRGLGGFLGRLDAFRMAGKAIEREPARHVLLFRGSMIGDVDSLGCLDEALAVHSMWKGYLWDPSFRTFLDFAERRRLRLEVAHASGHAHPEDLRRLAAAVAPRMLVPVHTTEPGSYRKMYGKVFEAQDGVPFDL